MRVRNVFLLFLWVAHSSLAQTSHESRLIDLAIHYEDGNSGKFYDFLDTEGNVAFTDEAISILRGPEGRPAVWKRTYDIEVEKTNSERKLHRIVKLQPDEFKESLTFGDVRSQRECAITYSFGKYTSYGDATIMNPEQFLLYSNYQGMMALGAFCKVGIIPSESNGGNDSLSIHAIFCREGDEEGLMNYDGYRVFEIPRNQ